MAIKPQERLFCHKYVANGHHKTKAIAAAGYSSKNPSAQAKRLLSKPEIQAYIDRIEKQEQALQKVNATGVICEIAKTAFFDLSEVAKIMQGDSVLDQEKWSEHARSAISSVKVTKTRAPDGSTHHTTEFKTWDRLKALKMLGEHVGAFTDLNIAIAVLKTYGIELAKQDGRWQVVE